MSNTQTLFTIKRTSLFFVMQILLVLPSFSQELFIRDVIAKPSKMVSPNAKSGDTQNNYQQERQIIDDYLKQINPNFSTDGFVPGVYFMRIYRNGELLNIQKLIVK